MLPPWPTRQIFDELLLAPRAAFIPATDTQRITRPGWAQLITPSLKSGGLNEVLLSALDEANVETTIDATLGQYAALGLRFRWAVWPDCSPPDLASRLERRGMTATHLRAMARATDGIDVVLSPQLRVERVDHDNVATFSRVTSEGWGMELVPLHAFHLRVLERSDEFPLYLAFDGDTPAGAGGAAVFARSMFLQGAVVLPKHRRRGVYRALVVARLTEARRLGLELATTHSNAQTSGPILDKLGFEEIFSFPMYVNR